MKKLLLATVLTGLMTGSVALAIPSSGQITVTRTAGSFFGDGGQFTGTVTGYPSFQTFCIEESVFFTPGNTYSYTLGLTDHSGQTLNLGTAWLFWQFASGDFAGGLALSPTDAGALQAALWYFQNQPNPGVSFGGLGIGDGLPTLDAFTDLALSTLGAAAYGAYDPSDPIFGGNQVRIIQSFDANGAPAQDWLVVTPRTVPDGGTTAILLGIGLLGVGLASRKFAAIR